mgnify:CR=1 FL=1
MTAASPPASPRPARNYSGLWTFLRLLGGWLTVAALAYLLWMPGEEFGWLKMMFNWVLLTLLADEFAGWFGYMGLALGVLPFLYAGTPEQWFVIFPLIGGALFALLIMKHAGGPFVLPFAGALFAGAILLAQKLGDMLGTPIKLVSNPELERRALLAAAIGLAFSFVRQLVGMLLRWQKRRRAAAVTVTTVTTTPAPVPAPPAPTSPKRNG